MAENKISKHDEAIRSIIDIAKKHGLTSEDLAVEAACVEEYGEWGHMCLLGFRDNLLREAVEKMEKEETETDEA